MMDWKWWIIQRASRESIWIQFERIDVARTLTRSLADQLEYFASSHYELKAIVSAWPDGSLKEKRKVTSVEEYLSIFMTSEDCYYLLHRSAAAKIARDIINFKAEQKKQRNILSHSNWIRERETKEDRTAELLLFLIRVTGCVEKRLREKFELWAFGGNCLTIHNERRRPPDH